MMKTSCGITQKRITRRAGTVTKSVMHNLHPPSAPALRNKVQLFDSYSELQQHDHEEHNFCTECDRSFQNQHNLQQHLNSKLHRLGLYAVPYTAYGRTMTALVRRRGYRKP